MNLWFIRVFTLVKIVENIFVSLENLTHYATMKRIHKGDKHFFSCEIYDDKYNIYFWTIYGLWKNLHSSGEESYSWKFCYYKFSASGFLKIQAAQVKILHESRKSFKCDNCDTSFAQRPDLNTHIVLVHEVSLFLMCNLWN